MIERNRSALDGSMFVWAAGAVVFLVSIFFSPRIGPTPLILVALALSLWGWYAARKRTRILVEAMLAGIGDAVITTDASGCIAFFNPVAEALSGLRQAEVRRKRAADVLRLVHEQSHEPVENLAGRALVMFNIAGDGTVQMLYPVDADPRMIKDDLYRLPVRVRGPFGSDLVIAVTSEQPMPMLEQALKSLNQRRGALAALKAVERYRPVDGRIGSTGIFTAP